MNSFLQRWDNFTLARKLALISGFTICLVLIGTYSLYEAMNTLSSVRAFVGGESHWTKAQKNSVLHLQRFLYTRDEKDFSAFLRELEVPLGDHYAKVELLKEDGNDEIIVRGFLAGGIHPDDIPGMMQLVRRFKDTPQLRSPMKAWKEGDVLIQKLIQTALDFRTDLYKNPHQSQQNIRAKHQIISDIDKQLTIQENEFARSMGEAARWMENVLIIVLITLIVTFASIGTITMLFFLNRMKQQLDAISSAANEVGKGNFQVRIPIHSEDEFGQLAKSINLMTTNLEKQISERRNAEEASMAKSLFLANMSHEIRTPLTAILGFSELLMNDETTDSEKERFMEIIKRSGHNLSTVINDILDLSKIEANQLSINKSVFSLSQLITDIQIWLQMKSTEKGLQLTLESRGDFSDYVYSDPIRIRQILSNLISNAIKFTKSGSVSVIYGVENGKLEFIVKDTGIGIPPEHIHLLFKPFSQGDSSIRKQFEGTGLGLVISRNLAQVLGGNVELVESAPNKGSTFRITLGYVPSTKEQMEVEKGSLSVTKFQPKSALLENKKILIVEDSEDNQYLFSLLLARTNAELEFASNGKVAIEKYFDTKHDLILMDMQMPVMDGFTATMELRRLGCKTPIVACTGYAMNGDKERCLNAGCDGFISKPIDSAELIFTLFKLIRKTA